MHVVIHKLRGVEWISQMLQNDSELFKKKQSNNSTLFLFFPIAILLENSLDVEEDGW